MGLKNKEASAGRGQSSFVEALGGVRPFLGLVLLRFVSVGVGGMEAGVLVGWEI